MDPRFFTSEVFRQVRYKDVVIADKPYKLSTHPYLDIILTDHCNAKCRFCVADLIHRKQSCDPAVFKAQIEHAVKEWGVREVLLLGGEPTISRHLIPMIEFCKTLPLEKICVTSNGRRLASDPAYRNILFASGLTHLNLSIMSFNETEQRFIHGTASSMGLEALKETYRSAVELGVQIRVNNNVYRGNNDTKDDLFRFYETVAPWCHSVKFSPLLKTDAFSTVPAVTDFNRKYILSDEEYTALFDGVMDQLAASVPVVENRQVFGFVEYRAALLNSPLILNYNHRGRMMQQALEGYINNIKLLPNGNLSKSWNREMPEHVLRFGAVCAACKITFHSEPPEDFLCPDCEEAWASLAYC